MGMNKFSAESFFPHLYWSYPYNFYHPTGIDAAVYSYRIGYTFYFSGHQYWIKQESDGAPACSEYSFIGPRELKDYFSDMRPMPRQITEVFELGNEVFFLHGDRYFVYEIGNLCFLKLIDLIVI